MSTRPRAILAIAALVVGASLVLSGCSLLPRIPTIGNNGGPSDSSDSSGDGAEDNPFLGHDVPEGFPAEVPLPDLDICYSLGTSDKSWSIIFKANELEGDFAAIVAGFEGAGWQTQMNNATAEGVLGVFMKEPLTAQVMGAPDGGDDCGGGPYLSMTVVQTN
jgi:hypothetical protein